MATADDLDPAQASRRASEGLQRAIESLDRHTEALAAPTMELALAQKQRASDIGLEELEPSALERRFISMAGPGAKIGTSEPGKLNPDASIPVGRPTWDENGLDQQSRNGARGIIPSGVSPNASSPIVGMNWEQAANMENEPIRIPITGDWRADAMLKLASQAAGKMAIKKNQNRYASQAGEETSEGKTPISMAKFQEEQGVAPMGQLSGILNKGASVATYTSALHQKILSPLADIGFGSTTMGASLGYNPQGGSLGPTTWHGIPNPLAAFGSEAGRQGLGTVVNAAEAAIGGSGIGIGEANSLRQSLAAQGWSNQRSGGAFGFTEGGNQENLALALEPLVKRGFNSPTSMEQLGEATNALKLGQANPEELKKVLEQLPEAAKILHKTLEEVTAGMEEFAAKSVEGGSSIIHGMKTYGEVSQITGMNPTIIQGINNSPFGKAQAISEGVKPWEIESMSGPMKSLSALKTLEKMEGYAGNQPGTKKTNKYGEVEEITPEQAKYSYIHMMGGPTEEQSKRLHEIGPKLEAVASGMHKAQIIGANVVGYQHGNQERSRAGQESWHDQNEMKREESWVKELEAKVKSEGLGGANLASTEINLETAKNNVKAKRAAIENSLSKAHKDIGLTGAEQKAIGNELQGPNGLYKRAEEAGAGNSEFAKELAKIKKDTLAQQPGEITKALEKVNQVNLEKENEQNAKVELTGEAKKWFKLQFPNAKSPKEEGNAGGKSTSSGATNITGAGTNANAKSYSKQSGELQRFEYTHGE